METTIDITYESYEPFSEDLGHRIPPVPTSYKNLVMACHQGDNDSLMKQLAEMPVRTPGGLSSILGSYITYSSPLCPIYGALFSGHVEVMRSLLRRAKIEDCLNQVVEKYIGIWGWRPLHLATLKRNIPMVKLLLEYGASVSSSTELRAQPAHIAAEVGSMEILDVLFNADANPRFADVDGHCPLDYLIEYLAKKRGHNDIISHGAELLHMACKNDFVGNLKALLSLGARAGGYSPRILQSALDTAIRCGSPLSVQNLVPLGVVPMGFQVFTPSS